MHHTRELRTMTRSSIRRVVCMAGETRREMRWWISCKQADSSDESILIYRDSPRFRISRWEREKCIPSKDLIQYCCTICRCCTAKLLCYHTLESVSRNICRCIVV